jgi:hypothetical protein
MGDPTYGKLYPSDARWCGFYDRLSVYNAGETERQSAVATGSGAVGPAWSRMASR